MAHRDLADDREPETAAARVARARVVEPHEPLEDAFALVGWNPGAVVVHRDGQLHRTLLHRGGPRRLPIRRAGELARRRAPRATFRHGSALDAKIPSCIAVTAIGEVFNYLFDPRHSLARIAKLYSDWGPQARDGAFWHEYSAPSAGPPPWDVYEITPTTFYAVANAEPFGATRWRL